MAIVYHHQPVLISYMIENLLSNRNLILDGTLGEGGHSLAFLEHGKQVIAFERDKQILAKAQQRLQQYNQITYVNQNFNSLGFLRKEYTGKIDFILFDLGISMFHYKESDRGFTFDGEQRLDMRLDHQGIDAYKIINTYKEKELAKIFFRYGEETKANLYASLICHARKEKEIITNKDLCKVILVKNQKRNKIHPATKIFQAIRIYVNDELNHIKKTLSNSLTLLNSNGCLAIISYHSLEDRIVKKFFKKIVPLKKQENKYRLKQKDKKSQQENIYFLEKKIILAGEEEVKKNPSARSAKMRILYKK